jgi:hypothetical protein
MDIKYVDSTRRYRAVNWPIRVKTNVYKALETSYVTFQQYPICCFGLCRCRWQVYQMCIILDVSNCIAVLLRSTVVCLGESILII